jgi:hypothetical protein
MHIRLSILFVLAACGTSETPPSAPPVLPDREAPAASAKLDLSGTIAFTGETKAVALFVSVKDPANPGPPLAAKQLPAGPFPMSFTLTDADVVQMGAGPRPMPATVALTVRLDTDGNAMSKDPTDPIATLETPSASKDLALTLTVPGT